MSTQQAAEFVNTPFDVGSVLQVPMLPANPLFNLSTTVGAGGSINSALVVTVGYKAFAFGVKSTQAGAVSIQRYIDILGTIPQGTPVTGTLLANTSLTVNCVDGLPFQSLIVSVSNSSGSSATLTKTMLLLQAN